MYRKTPKELEADFQATRPVPQTPIFPIEIEYCIGDRRKETFKDKETLLWALSFQNPSCLRQIQARYPLVITGTGKAVQVEFLEVA